MTHETLAPHLQGRDGRHPKVNKWWLELRDHNGIVRRFPAFTDKAASHTFGENIRRLVSAKLSGESLTPDTIAWLSGQPGKVLRHFIEIGLINDHFATNQQPLTVHLEDFRTHLTAKGTTEQQIEQVISRVKRIFDSCEPRCIWWRDVNATTSNQPRPEGVALGKPARAG